MVNGQPSGSTLSLLLIAIVLESGYHTIPRPAIPTVSQSWADTDPVVWVPLRSNGGVATGVYASSHVVQACVGKVAEQEAERDPNPRASVQGVAGSHGGTELGSVTPSVGCIHSYPLHESPLCRDRRGEYPTNPADSVLPDSRKHPMS